MSVQQRIAGLNHAQIGRNQNDRQPRPLLPPPIAISPRPSITPKASYEAKPKPPPPLPSRRPASPVGRSAPEAPPKLPPRTTSASGSSAESVSHSPIPTPSPQKQEQINSVRASPSLPTRPASSRRPSGNDSLTSQPSSQTSWEEISSGSEAYNSRAPIKKAAPPPPVSAKVLRPTGLATWAQNGESSNERGSTDSLAKDPAPSSARASPTVSNSNRPASIGRPGSDRAPSPADAPRRVSYSNKPASRGRPERDSPSPPRLPPRVPNSNKAASIGHPARDPAPNPADRSLAVSQDSVKHHAQDDLPSTPPPVPLMSRPDLSKIQATKPRFHSYSHGDSGRSFCLKCRDFSAPDAHAAKFPRQSLPSRNIPWLANELTAPFPSPTDKARVIFTWLHHNIAYDTYGFFNKCLKPKNSSDTLSTGLAVCQGYAELFQELATHSGLQAKVISGHGKGFGYQQPAPGSPLPPFNAGHAWNVVKIDNGQWKLVDACWGAGIVDGTSCRYTKKFNPLMFVSTNSEFGLGHFPTDPDQLYREDGRRISWEEYLLRPKLNPCLYTDCGKYNIGEYTFQPATDIISVHQRGPVRFQFGLICPHWSIERQSKQGPAFFLLSVNRPDGGAERIPFNHIPGSNPGGGGDTWYVDVADSRTLGVPGQSVSIMVLTGFGDWQHPRGLTIEEYLSKVNRIAMGWVGIARWDLR